MIHSCDAYGIRRPNEAQPELGPHAKAELCFARTPAALKRLTCHDPMPDTAVMILTILQLLSLILNALRLSSDLALENPALRQQLAILNRHRIQPRRISVGRHLA